MNYIELINRFWQEVDIKGWTPIETNIYFRLLDFCNRSGWRNPFALPNPRAVALMAVTENTLAAGRDRLVRKGLIGFKKGSRRSEAPLYCFPEKVDGEWVFPDSFTSKFEAKQGVKPMAKQGVKPMAKPRTYNKTKTKTEIIPSKNNLPSRTHEDFEIERIDSYIQEFYEEKHQQWEDVTKKNFRIDSVRDYLPLFRDYIISNALTERINSINDFKSYFTWRFKEFKQLDNIRLLGEYEANAKSEKFRKFCKWLAKDNQNVAHGVVPLSEEEFDKLFDAFDSKRIFDAIRNLNEREDLITKYFSLYGTLVKWMKNE